MRRGLNRGLRALVARLGPESREVHAYCEWFHAAHPKAWPYLYHVPNEQQDKTDRLILSLLGVKAGVSDFSLTLRRPGFVGMWLEFKASGKSWADVTSPQREWLDRMAGQGWFTAVGYGIDHAMAITAAYLAGADLHVYWHGAKREIPRRGYREYLRWQSAL